LVKNRWAISFLLPALIFYVFVVIVPSFQGVKFAFTDWSGFTQGYNWAGLTQFRRVLADSDTRGALSHTFVIAIGVTIFQNLVGLLLALGLFSKVKSRNLLRTLFFAPAVVAPVATAYLWQYMYAPTGPINSLFETLGLQSFIRDWLGDPSIVLNSIIVVVIWQFAGYSMVIYLAGLEGVPKELIEAAEIDGASPLKSFTQIKLPLVVRTLGPLLVASIAMALNNFGAIYLLTGGGPTFSNSNGNAGATDILISYTYKLAFNSAGGNNYGLASALSILNFILVGLISIYGLRKMKTMEEIS
jgi:raffinose/stachyose/melibiose transport system permease protein